ncbi:MAG: ribosome-associated translation inhibitor RaiA [Patescibacteria group bacterium]|nr:ribosome-associated translation inhibitor RaiA [Patescibacteria group bacterium]
MEIKIYKQNFGLSDDFDAYLREKFSALEKYQEEIMDFQVNLKGDRHHRKGDIYKVEVKVILPHKKPIIIKESDADPRRAVDIIQEKISRQLIKHKDKKFARLRKNIRRFKSLKFWKKKDL